MKAFNIVQYTGSSILLNMVQYTPFLWPDQYIYRDKYQWFQYIIPLLNRDFKWLKKMELNLFTSNLIIVGVKNYEFEDKGLQYKLCEYSVLVWRHNNWKLGTAALFIRMQ